MKKLEVRCGRRGKLKMADSDLGFASDNGVLPVEVDPAAAFLAQQETDIAVIESEIPVIENNDDGGPGALDGSVQQPPVADSPAPGEYDAGFAEASAATVNGNRFVLESNGPSDSYAAISQVDSLRAEPESLRKWREEQKARLEQLDSASKAAEAEWKEKAKKELEDWHVHQNEQMEKNKANNRASEEAFLSEADGDSPGTEWEKVARLCDFNPKTNKTAKDVSRMRSVLIALKQTPLVR
ncbi:clathrin light chain B isoform X3 [Salmo salar]|uniref:Clathrin light chain n=1 Tax=Salmo salar TaxID=8030 RepID=A0A1S3RNS0_SALSA|nr:clathrin light chain B isoform X3 [Salmo salar]|eukprot:XP_014053981.1 PREDICTED: clathrin light chain B isoform X3 [Salmo salar]